MTVDELIRSLTPEIYSNLKSSLELGRWPDGRTLTKEQKAICMEAVIQYEVINDIPTEQRTGHIEGGCKSKKGDDEQPLTIQ